MCLPVKIENSSNEALNENKYVPRHDMQIIQIQIRMYVYIYVTIHDVYQY